MPHLDRGGCAFGRGGLRRLRYSQWTGMGSALRAAQLDALKALPGAM